MRYEFSPALRICTASPSASTNVMRPERQMPDAPAAPLSTRRSFRLPATAALCSPLLTSHMLRSAGSRSLTARKPRARPAACRAGAPPEDRVVRVSDADGPTGRRGGSAMASRHAIHPVERYDAFAPKPTAPSPRVCPAEPSEHASASSVLTLPQLPGGAAPQESPA
jgi:hypothetical protein